MSDSRPTAERSPFADDVVGEVEEWLRARERHRDTVHDRARALRRLAQETMRRLHAGPVAPEEVERLRAGLRDFAAGLRGEYREEAALGSDALQEGAEALLLDRVIRGGPLPGPSELGVPPEPYLLAVGDLVGEVRRLCLRALSDGNPDRAEGRLALMEELFHTLMSFDAPRSIVSLKPKQDTARALVERTRGEVTMARMLHRAGPGRSEGSAR